VSIFVSLTVVAGMILLVTPREEILVLYVVLLALIWGVELNRSVRRCESTLQRASPEIWSWMKNGFLFGAFHNLHPRFVKMMLTNNASLPDEARSQLRACLRSHIEAICVIVWMLIAINVFKSFYV
jgi:ABC-type nickel/cobalt efflux system permease component RcnA